MAPSLFNFILYCEEPLSSPTTLSFLQLMNAHFPCKLFLLHHKPLEDKLPPSLLYQERLSIDGLQPEEVMIALYPKLVPDLPLYLFWSGELFEEKGLLDLLLPNIDRMIIDSQSFTASPEWPKRLKERIQRPSFEIVDLSWMRLQGWRQLLFHLYSSDLSIDHLRTAQRILIHCNRRLPVQAGMAPLLPLLLLSWIATTLHWKLLTVIHDEEKTLLSYRHRGGECEVVIHQHEPEEPFTVSEALLRMNIQAKDGGWATIVREEKGGVAMIHLFNEERCLLPFSLPLRDEALSLRTVRSLLYAFEKENYLKMIQLLPNQFTLT